MSNVNEIEKQLTQKQASGIEARKKWGKEVNIVNMPTTESFNEQCGNVFSYAATIEYDNSAKRQTVIRALPIDSKSWKKEGEVIYLLEKDGYVVKIGGTRKGMADRFSSYNCGHHVPERGKSGRMSVTNAHLYHSIEKDMIEKNGVWKIYIWNLPIVQISVNILGDETKINAQTYHAYESKCIEKFKNMCGTLPILCDNSDPKYR